MFKKTTLILAICFCSIAFSAGTIFRAHVTVKAKRTDKKPITILIKAKSSDQKIVIEVPPSEAPSTYEGTYVLELDKNSDPDNLEFSLRGERKGLYMVSEETPSQTNFSLFQSQTEAKEFSKNLKPSVPPPIIAVKPEVVAVKPEVLIEQARISAQKQEEQRVSLELEEAQKREAAQKKLEQATLAEKTARAQKAIALINQANQLYAQGEFQESTYAYSQAIELDPSMDEAYYRYGVSLYKIKDYNKSLAVLSMGEGGTQNKAEYDYYVALNHMKLKEFEKAVEGFHSVRDENDKEISPTAAFLAGNIEFQTQNFAEAKKDYEYVVDHSTDPKMDQEAEKRIEEIDRIEQYAESKKEIFHYTFTAGLSKDSNILNISQNNLAINDDGYRFNYSGTLLYKIIQNYKSEFAAQLAYSDIYTFDSSFAPKAILQSADPQFTTVSMPYKSWFESGKSTYLWSVTPSVSTLTMDVTGTGTNRKQILESHTLDADLTYQANATLFSSFRMQFDQDLSFGTTRGTDDDQSATRSTLGTTQTFLFDPNMTRTLAGDFSYSMNDAKGKNSSFNKAILGIIYGFPGIWKTTSNFKIEYTNLNYFENTANRKDTTLSATLSTGKAFGKNLSAAATLQYLKNQSSTDIYDYNKTVIGILFIYGGSVSKK